MDSRPSFYYATGTAYFLDIFGSGYGQIGGGSTVLVPGIAGGKTITWDGAPANDPFPWMVNPKLWDAMRVKFADAAFPMNMSIAQGTKVTCDLIRARPGKFALGGYSQGAAVMSNVLKELRTGSLQARYQDLLGMVTFGNPMREVNHTWPGALWSGSFDDENSTTGGHGCFPASVRLVDTPSLCWDFANIGEIITSVGDGPLGTNLQFAVNFITNYADRRAFFDWLKVTLLTPFNITIKQIEDTLNAVKAIGDHGHVSYPVEPPPGDPQNGLTSYQIALNYLEEIGAKWQQGSSATWTPQPTTIIPKIGTWSENPSPSSILNRASWFAQEAEVGSLQASAGTLTAKVVPRQSVSLLLSGSGAVNTASIERLNQTVNAGTVAFSNIDTSEGGTQYSGLSGWGYSLKTNLVYFNSNGLLDGLLPDGLSAYLLPQNTETGVESGDGTFAVSVFQKYSLTTAFSGGGVLDLGGDLSSTGNDGFWVTYAPAFADQQSGAGTLGGTVYIALIRIPVSLAGIGALTGAAIGKYARAAALAGAGTLTGTARMYSLNVSTALSGAGALTSTARMYALNVAGALSGSGSISGTAFEKYARGSDLAGAGALSSAARIYSVNIPGALAGSGSMSATTAQSYAVAAAFGGGGGLSATATFPTTSPATTTYTTAGSYTYSIPYWCNSFDVVCLGAGGGGNGGGAGYVNGGGGGEGSYSVKTYIRGTDVPWTQTSLSGVVGAAGSAGADGGHTTADPVTFGAAGGGLFDTTADNSSTISGSFTHTPDSKDNYVVVALQASTTGAGSYSTFNRTVTYGGTTMTSFGAVDGYNQNKGFTELFGLAITPGQGAKTVAVTVSTNNGRAATYYSLAANSVSYSNVGGTSAISTAYGNSSSPAITVSGNYTGYVAVGGCYAENTNYTLTQSVTGGTSRWYSGSNQNDVLTIVERTASSSTALSTSISSSSWWACTAVMLRPVTFGAGGDGGKGQGTQQNGYSPGNYTLNSVTYTGGTGGTGNAGAGVAPGAGGAGGNGVLLGSSPGGAGSAGKVWIRAYQ